MTYAEALYAYNQWITMSDWVDGLGMALVAGEVSSEEMPALLECHGKALEKAIEATTMFNRTDTAEPLKKYRETLHKAIADIVRLNKEFKDAQPQ